MASEKLSFRQTGYFSDLICDYWEGLPALRAFYQEPPDWSSFDRIIARREQSFPVGHRATLVRALRAQYVGLPSTPAVEASIGELGQPGTFTVVTGHQLNLFTGPLFFFYKILACINLAEELRRRYPASRFVPVYWMASEDHDFEEINHFRIGGQVLSWDHPSGGPVGRFDLSGLDRVAAGLDRALPRGQRGEELRGLFARAYLQSRTLVEAHRRLVHELFGEYGLVCLDGDDALLKGLAAPCFERDLTDEISFSNASADSRALKALSGKYATQAHPRQVNFFYLNDGLRSRITKHGHHFGLVDADRSWTLDTLISELRQEPQRFSPNVIMRPVYQEAVLPNLAYIGGGGELAYWLQLKGTLSAHNLPFPLLLLRPSLLLVGQKALEKAGRLDILPSELFADPDTLVNRRIRKISQIDIDFSPLQRALSGQFEYLYELARQTDPTFMRAVRAEEARQVKGLGKLEQRLLNAQRRKLSDEVQRVTRLRELLFPGGSLQERTENFVDYYQLLGPELLPFLKGVADPIPDGFRIAPLPV